MDALSLDYLSIAPDDPRVADLIACHAAHGDAHYPAESNHHQDGAAMSAEGVVLFAGLRDGRAVAMGGYKVIAPGHGEVKSMHVSDAARGQGAGSRILEIILAHARDAGLARLSLETGSLDGSAAARRLYERAGFSYCAPFGAYEEDPMSVFMTRPL
jgi:putative acetyltransferase